VHICFGYAAIIHARPEGYSFLPELAGSPVDQISIETAQSGLDLGVLRDLTDKTIILGVLDLSTPEVEDAETVAARARRAFDLLPPEQLVLAPDCGLKYLPRASAAGKARALAQGAALLRGEVGDPPV
jgi:5-methyltetrahydropteroyltriglutamate--homocysteine methyltransferase